MAESLHHGQVVEVDYKKCLARIAYDDLGSNFTSGWLPVNFQAMGGVVSTHMPRIGDHVTALRPENGEQEAIILGTRFTEGKPPQNCEEGVLQWYAEDGKSYIRFDAREGSLDLQMQAGCRINIHGGGAEITATEAVTVKCQSLAAEASGMIKFKGGTIALEAAAVQIDGNISHTGNMDTSGTHTDANGVHQ